MLNSVFLGDKGDQAAIERGREKLATLAPILEAGLDCREYLAGATPSIADLSVGSNIFHLGFADAMPDTPNITGWFARISAIEGFQKSLPQQEAA